MALKLADHSVSEFSKHVGSGSEMTDRFTVSTETDISVPLSSWPNEEWTDGKPGVCNLMLPRIESILSEL